MNTRQSMPLRRRRREPRHGTPAASATAVARSANGCSFSPSRKPRVSVPSDRIDTHRRNALRIAAGRPRGIGPTQRSGLGAPHHPRPEHPCHTLHHAVPHEDGPATRPASLFSRPPGSAVKRRRFRPSPRGATRGPGPRRTPRSRAFRTPGLSSSRAFPTLGRTTMPTSRRAWAWCRGRPSRRCRTRSST
jgi:hypothetical protein